MNEHTTEFGQICHALDRFLGTVAPKAIEFHTAADIDNLTHAQAMEVIRATRRMMLHLCLYQEYHEHMLDDCGDDLAAATENWAALHHMYFDHDGDEATVVMEVRKFLCMHSDYPLGGVDGEIRYALIPNEQLFEQLEENQNA